MSTAAILKNLRFAVSEAIRSIKEAGDDEFASDMGAFRSAALLAEKLGLMPPPFADVTCERGAKGDPPRETTCDGLTTRNKDHFLIGNPGVILLTKIELRHPISGRLYEFYLWCVEEPNQTRPIEDVRVLGNRPSDKRRALRVLRAWVRYVDHRLSEHQGQAAPANAASQKDKPETGDEPLIVGASASDQQSTLEAIVSTLAGESAIAILAVAHDATKSVDTRMREIYRLDQRAVGWSSDRWAKLLDVTASAVRQTEWWRKDRARLSG